MKFKFTWTSAILLVVVLGIVAMIVIPSYGDYAHRAQASEAVALLGGAKTPLAEYFAEQKKWPDTLDKVASGTSGKFTRAVTISKGAGGTGQIELTATMKTEGVDRRVAGQSVRMISADGGRTWVCRPGTMATTNLPATCRE